ncbi:DegT/DnrJ/EryC1/StrS family aminotransferase [Kineococcus arenarius]|uniref:DegT/DnrJ/EryC1/StrS family aminotransferase n=1 Tax=unclassified Kineococcus TaxID=2621656 RepID=UPI003D7D838D
MNALDVSALARRPQEVPPRRERVNVTRSFLPPQDEYRALLDRIWSGGQLTNGGPLMQDLEARLRDELGVVHLQVVANGTLALQLALRALDVTGGEVITTPFSYVATVSSVLWERCTPVFVDIDPWTFCIDASRVEEAITPDTRAILGVHVFGAPCDTDTLEHIGRQHGVPVIYDAAHAFGVRHQGRSLLDFGDVSTCSFHATKVFHTIEGGCVVARDPEVNRRLDLIKRFGHHFDEHLVPGTNAKASEFQAAMGLVNLPYVEQQRSTRRHLAGTYDALLPEHLQKQQLPAGTEPNYSYYPVVFPTEARLLQALRDLEEENIFPRRYFHPSLNTLPYLPRTRACPVSESIAQRILCLPLYAGLEENVVQQICEVL